MDNFPLIHHDNSNTILKLYLIAHAAENYSLYSNFFRGKGRIGRGISAAKTD